MNFMGMAAAIVIVVVIWMNPHLIGSFTGGFQDILKDWKNGKTEAPHIIIGKDKIPKPVKRGDRPAEKLIDQGTPQEIENNPEKLPEGGNSTTSQDPETFPENRHNDSSQKPKKKKYSFGARAVGIQKARGL